MRALFTNTTAGWMHYYEHHRLQKPGTATLSHVLCQSSTTTRTTDAPWESRDQQTARLSPPLYSNPTRQGFAIPTML